MKVILLQDVNKVGKMCIRDRKHAGLSAYRKNAVS